MIYNLLTLRSEILNGLKKSDISTSRRDRWINDAQDDLITEIDPSFLSTNYTVTSTINDRNLLLDLEFMKIQSVMDTTSQITLTPTSEYEIESADESVNDTGTPYFYSLEGVRWTKAQPSSASVITIVSDDITDTSQKVRIHGYVGGVENTELIALNGTTPAVGTLQFTETRQVMKDLITTGKVTITSNTGLVTLAEIPAYLLAKSYQVLKLWPIPSGANSYSIRGIRKIRPFINTEDISELPEVYHELILIGALMRGARDLYRMKLYEHLVANEWIPKVRKLKKQMGNNRGRTAPVIEGQFPNKYVQRYDEPLG